MLYRRVQALLSLSILVGGCVGGSAPVEQASALSSQAQSVLVGVNTVNFKLATKKIEKNAKPLPIEKPIVSSTSMTDGKPAPKKSNSSLDVPTLYSTSTVSSVNEPVVVLPNKMDVSLKNINNYFEVSNEKSKSKVPAEEIESVRRELINTGEVGERNLVSGVVADKRNAFFESVVIEKKEETLNQVEGVAGVNAIEKKVIKENKKENVSKGVDVEQSEEPLRSLEVEQDTLTLSVIDNADDVSHAPSILIDPSNDASVDGVEQGGVKKIGFEVDGFVEREAKKNKVEKIEVVVNEKEAIVDVGGVGQDGVEKIGVEIVTVDFDVALIDTNHNMENSLPVDFQKNEKKVSSGVEEIQENVGDKLKQAVSINAIEEKVIKVNKKENVSKGVAVEQSEEPLLSLEVEQDALTLSVIDDADDISRASSILLDHSNDSNIDGGEVVVDARVEVDEFVGREAKKNGVEEIEVVANEKEAVIVVDGVERDGVDKVGVEVVTDAAVDVAQVDTNHNIESNLPIDVQKNEKKVSFGVEETQDNVGDKIKQAISKVGAIKGNEISASVSDRNLSLYDAPVNKSHVENGESPTEVYIIEEDESLAGETVGLALAEEIANSIDDAVLVPTVETTNNSIIAEKGVSNAVEDLAALVDNDISIAAKEDDLKIEKVFQGDDESVKPKIKLSDNSASEKGKSAFVIIKQGDSVEKIPAVKKSVDKLRESLSDIFGLDWNRVIPGKRQINDERFEYCYTVLTELRQEKYTVFSPYNVSAKDYNRWQQKLGEISLVQLAGQSLNFYQTKGFSNQNINMVETVFEADEKLSKILLGVKKDDYYFSGVLSFGINNRQSLGGVGRFYKSQDLSNISWYLIAWGKHYYAVRLQKVESVYESLEIIPLLYSQQKNQRNCRWANMN